MFGCSVVGDEAAGSGQRSAGQGVLDAAVAVAADHLSDDDLVAGQPAPLALLGLDMRRVKLTLRSGPPSRVIERAAARLAPDLIAVGHSASLIGRFFLGSIARHVLRMDIGDVLVARAG